MAAEKPKTTMISLRISRRTEDLLRRLAEKWGENRSRVIERCIEIAARESGKK